MPDTVNMAVLSALEEGSGVAWVIGGDENETLADIDGSTLDSAVAAVAGPTTDLVCAIDGRGVRRDHKVLGLVVDLTRAASVITGAQDAKVQLRLGSVLSNNLSAGEVLTAVQQEDSFGSSSNLSVWGAAFASAVHANALAQLELLYTATINTMGERVLVDRARVRAFTEAVGARIDLHIVERIIYDQLQAIQAGGELSIVGRGEEAPSSPGEGAWVQLVAIDMDQPLQQRGGDTAPAMGEIVIALTVGARRDGVVGATGDLGRLGTAVSRVMGALGDVTLTDNPTTHTLELDAAESRDDPHGANNPGIQTAGVTIRGVVYRESGAALE